MSWIFWVDCALNFAFTSVLLSWLFEAKVILTVAEAFNCTVEDVSSKYDCNDLDDVYDDSNDDNVDIEFKELDSRVLSLDEESSSGTTELIWAVL